MVDQPQSWIERGSSETLEWLRRIESGDVEGPNQPQWWLAMATAASQKARWHLDREWADVAIRTYQLGADLVEAGERHSIEASAMMLRAYMISRLGAIAGDRVLDPGIITLWFRERTSITPSQAVEMIAPLDTMPVDQIRELRRIKNRLGVIDFLATSVPGVVTEDLRRWLEIRHRMP